LSFGALSRRKQREYSTAVGDAVTPLRIGEADNAWQAKADSIRKLNCAKREQMLDKVPVDA